MKHQTLNHAIPVDNLFDRTDDPRAGSSKPSDREMAALEDLFVHSGLLLDRLGSHYNAAV